LSRIGTFYGRGNGNWGQSELAPLRSTDGSQGVFSSPGGATTLRVTARSGDFDAIILSPISVPAKLQSGPVGNSPFSVPRSVTWVLEDFTTTINTNTISLTVGGTPVAAADLSVTKTGGITTVRYLAPLGVPQTYQFTATDSAGTTITNAGTLIGNFKGGGSNGLFLIEAEDFNSQGTAQAVASTMPYRGNAYAGLPATAGIDFWREDATPDGNIYRTNEVPNVPMSTDGDLVRATDASGATIWTVTNNFRLGWAGGGRWMDYTRNIPAGNYQVWASMSFGDPGADVINGILSTVTGDVTTTNQTASVVGYFSGPTTGGWGANQLIPLRLTDPDQTGSAAVVQLGGAGATTLRFEYASADFDYMMLVPATPIATGPELEFSVSGGNLTITWTTPGTLETSTTFTGWTAVPGVTGNSYTTAPTDAARFFRLRAQ
jgi:hypothetical protein